MWGTVDVSVKIMSNRGAYEKVECDRLKSQFYPRKVLSPLSLSSCLMVFLYFSDLIDLIFCISIFLDVIDLMFSVFVNYLLNLHLCACFLFLCILDE